MSEEVKDENVSQSAKDIITAIKEADSFGPFGKSEPSDAKNWVQWQCLNVDSVHLHYEIIAKKDTIYAEFHIEPKQNVSEEIIKAFEENIADATASLDGITKYPEWQARGFAIRWGDGVDVQNKKPDTVKEELSGQMEALHTAIDGVVSQHLIKYIFKDLIDNSDSSGEKFLKAFNDRIYKFYNENNKDKKDKKDKKGSEKASYLLVRLLEQVHEQYPQWRLPFGEKSAKRIFNQDNVKDLFGENPKEKETILIEKFIEKIKNEKFWISPFSFWSIFFSHNNEFATQQRPSVLSSLLNALRGDESNRKNIVQSLIDLRVAKARLLSKQKKGEEKDDLTIEGWTQLVDNLSKFDQICWELFKEVMTDNPNKDTINGYIQDIITNKKNGENVTLGCDGVGKEAVPNILPFIRPDLQFYFDTDGNITSIIRSKEMEIQDTIELLKSSKQIILTGAPGTGKTYLAKEIAKKMTDGEDENIAFCQFHPSFDYTDFVEGLRPFDNGSGNIGFKLTDGIFKDFCKKALTAVPEKEKVSLQNFVFIIDEINRGDISKIFGELFFAIDPGYRGEKGRVKTQYHNLIKNTDDLYKDGFYIPENVYIIGTMNDIDRSVESMDFAIRRRFTWKEIKAEDRISMLDDIKLSEDLKNDAKARMKALNTEISKTDSLSEAFHVGPAYFRKLEEYEGDFSKLWDLHIMPLLKEYLRGTVDPENDLKRFKDAYDLKKQTDNESASTASEE